MNEIDKKSLEKARELFSSGAIDRGVKIFKG